MQHSAPTSTEEKNSNNSILSRLTTYTKEEMIKYWRINRWIPIAAGLVAFIFILICGLTIMTLLSPTPQTTEGAEETVDSTSKVPTTKNSSDNDFFSQQPDTIIYYSFAQTTNSKNMIQATPTDRENRIIDIGYPDRFSFSTSPDGKWLIRWNKSQLDRSSAASPAEFTTLATVKENQQITSVVWQADSSTIALSKVTKQVTDKQYTTISVIPQLTLDTEDVYTVDTTPTIELVAFPSANKLYIQQNDGGILSNLSWINPQTGTLDETITHLDRDDALARIVYDNQMNYGYLYNETSITQININSGQLSTVYEFDNFCSHFEPIKKQSVTGISVSPSGNQLLFTEDMDYCGEVRQNAKIQDKTLPQTRLSIYNLKDKKIDRQADNPPASGIDKSLWSQDEAYVWISASPDSAYMLTMKDLSMTPIPNLDRQALLKERVFPIGWLRSQK